LPQDLKEFRKSLTAAERVVLQHPATLARDLGEFRKTARVLSSRRANFIKKYPKRWIGLYRSQVLVNGKTLDEVLAQADAKGIPRANLLIRFIDNEDRVLIV
jgi:hypothetical protein